ncbi:MAG TPA: heavy metal sensor histidine kinase [Desulfomonilia bacterium]|nr:heavy metal sensor histidine kinase [Desulfomonilia bacterium]
MIRSIRLRFFFWYTLVLAVTFSVFAVALYYNVSSTLKNQMDDLLLTKAEGIARSINTYWETEKMDALKHGARRTVFSKINNANFLKIAKRWVEEQSNDPDLMDIIVQIYKPDGELIAYSQNAMSHLNISEKTLHRLTTNKTAYEDRRITLAEDRYLDLRVLQIPVFEEGRMAYIVQVAGPLNSIWETLKGLKFILFLLLPITVVITSVLAGEFLASITLKPLNKMIVTARQITAENLSLRIDPPETQDEIRQLAETFNEMLGKIQQVFISQKQFIQDISHELRTPLTIMRGELEVAMKRQRSPEEYCNILKSNLEETNKISQLLENLLTLARFDNSSATLTRDPEEISTIMRDILDDMEILAHQKGIEIEFVSQAGVILPLDKDKIMRAFINILDNAIKFTPENGKISIEILQEKACAIITITDTGIGIPEHDLPRIFDRFYQVDKSRSSKGFGLGLSISRSIVEAHGGSITVESTRKHGTTFLISLPISGLAADCHPSVSHQAT